MFKKYRVTKDFKGSITGADVTLFIANQVIDEQMIGDDLLCVAIKEKWAEEIKPKTAPLQASKQLGPVREIKAPPKRGKK